MLKGRGDDDSLRSRGGNDRMLGGSGADTFIYTSKSGRDMVMDFETGTDTIDLRHWNMIGSFGQLQSHAGEHGDDLWIVAGHEILIIRQ